MLQQGDSLDCVVGTGQAHSVEEFVKCAFEYAGLDYTKYIETDQRYFRPTEVESLVADNSKAKKILDWQPRIEFSELVKIMVDADMRAIGLEAVGQGDKILREKFPDKWWEGG